MSKEQRIEHICDLLKFSDEEVERLIPDLIVWIYTSKKLLEALPGSEMKAMIWVDDGKPGQVHHIDISEPDGKTTRYTPKSKRDEEQ